jgi:hypothetical protein
MFQLILPTHPYTDRPIDLVEIDTIRLLNLNQVVCNLNFSWGITEVTSSGWKYDVLRYYLPPTEYYLIDGRFIASTKLFPIIFGIAEGHQEEAEEMINDACDFKRKNGASINDKYDLGEGEIHHEIIGLNTFYVFNLQRRN